MGGQDNGSPPPSKPARSGSGAGNKSTRDAVGAKPFRLDRRSLTVLQNEIDSSQPSSPAKQQQSGAVDTSEPGADRDGSMSWRHRVVHFLHSNTVHYPMTALLVLDLILVVVSLELQIQVYRLEGVAKGHCLEAFETQTAVPAYLEGDPTCNPEGLHHCDYHESSEYQTAHLLHEIELGLAFCSMGILSIFLLENLIMMAALGLSYFKYFFFVLDLVVVSVSLGLEIWAVTTSMEGAVALGLLVLARMWRFFRVAHGVYFLEHSEEAVEEPLQASIEKESHRGPSDPEEETDV